MLMGLASAYIIYLGYSLVRSAAAGEEGMPAWLGFLFGFVFIAVGGLYLMSLIRDYRRLKAKESREALPEEKQQESGQETEALPGEAQDSGEESEEAADLQAESGAETDN
jgi:TRAP-type C4-dicarboxylate transport system permease small subunit